jgi:hypothetical protein
MVCFPDIWLTIPSFICAGGFATAASAARCTQPTDQHSGSVCEWRATMRRPISHSCIVKS